MASRVILYGRNPVREALRGRRAHSVSEVWAMESVAHEPWLDSVSVKVCWAEDIERHCWLLRPTKAFALRPAATPTSAPMRCSRSTHP